MMDRPLIVLWKFKMTDNFFQNATAKINNELFSILKCHNKNAIDEIKSDDEYEQYEKQCGSICRQ